MRLYEQAQIFTDKTTLKLSNNSAVVFSYHVDAGGLFTWNKLL